MINILHVTYDMRLGGTEMVIKQLVEHLDDERFKPSIFCLQSTLGPWGVELKNKGVDVFCHDWQSGIDLRAIFHIRRIIKSNKIDILHCHQYTPWFYGALATYGLNVKVIFTEHGRFYPDRKSFKRRFINPILSSLTAQITAISQSTAKALEDFEYIPRDRVEVIYNGISSVEPKTTESVRETLGISDDTLVLGTIARLDPIKNHPMMLRSLRSLLNKGLKAHLLIVGDGETKTELKAEIARLDLQKQVTLTGYISSPFDYLAAMDLFLLTSYSEGTSMTLLEAMRAGKPCLVTNVGGNPEVIKDAYNGFVVESDDDQALTEAVESLMNDEDLCAHMQKAARDRFEEMFTAQKMTETFTTIYHSNFNQDQKD